MKSPPVPISHLVWSCNCSFPSVFTRCMNESTHLVKETCHLCITTLQQTRRLLSCFTCSKNRNIDMWIRQRRWTHFTEVMLSTFAGRNHFIKIIIGDSVGMSWVVLCHVTMGAINICQKLCRSLLLKYIDLCGQQMWELLYLLCHFLLLLFSFYKCYSF